MVMVMAMKLWVTEEEESTIVAVVVVATVMTLMKMIVEVEMVPHTLLIL